MEIRAVGEFEPSVRGCVRLCLGLRVPVGLRTAFLRECVMDESPAGAEGLNATQPLDRKQRQNLQRAADEEQLQKKRRKKGNSGDMQPWCTRLHKKAGGGRTEGRPRLRR